MCRFAFVDCCLTLWVPHKTVVISRWAPLLPTPQLPPALLPKLQRLVTEGSYRPARAAAPGSGGAPAPSSSLEDIEGLPALRCAFCRVIMTASRQVPQLEAACKVIKVGRTRLGRFVLTRLCVCQQLLRQLA